MESTKETTIKRYRMSLTVNDRELSPSINRHNLLNPTSKTASDIKQMSTPSPNALSQRLLMIKKVTGFTRYGSLKADNNSDIFLFCKLMKTHILSCCEICRCSHKIPVFSVCCRV